ncbi:GAF and ANTAR domain-containing protein [Jatrophihabitans sp. YIM 134969]
MTITPHTLAHTMVDVARLLHHEVGVQNTWNAITRLAVAQLDGVDHAGITVVRRGEFSTPASSGRLPEDVDALQYETGQGPCLSAISEEGTFRTADLAAETERWPRFSRRAAAELDVHSMLSMRLFVQDDTLGALNFYSHRIGAFDDTIAEAGALFAAHAALALSNADEQDENLNLKRALDSSRLIGAATGILMAHHRLTQEQAFDVLRQVSQNSNRKLRDVADDVVHTGAVPSRGQRD